MVNGGSVGIHENSSTLVKFNINPNPSHDNIVITNEKKIYKEIEITILTLNGKEVFRKDYHNKNLMELNIGTFAGGIYLIKIKTEEGIEVKKLIVD